MSKFFRRSSSKSKSGYDFSESSRSMLEGGSDAVALHSQIGDLAEKLVEYQRATLSRLDSVENNMLRTSQRHPQPEEPALHTIRESTKIIRQSSASSNATSTRPSVMPLPYRSHVPTGFEEDRNTVVPASSGDVRDEIYKEALDEMKRQVENIRRDVMVELHTTKYDLLKEMALLKGSVLRLVDVLERGDLGNTTERLHRAVSDTSTDPASSSDTENESSFDEASSTELPAAPYVPKSTRGSTRMSTRGSVRASSKSSKLHDDYLRESTNGRMSTRSIKNEALSQPWETLLAKNLPLLESKPKNLVLKATRTWALESFRQWKHNPQSQILAVVGEHGTGKTTFLSHLIDQNPDAILASHFIRFDQQVDTTKIVLSLARQIANNVPDYQDQLKRLNIPYLAQEPDAIKLATKLLVEPLHALTTIIPQHVIVLDGLDEDSGLQSTRLVDLLSAIALEFPPWVCFVIGNNTTPEIMKKLPSHDLISFNMKNTAFAADCMLLVQAMAKKHGIALGSDVMALLKGKSQGNMLYLQFVDQAFTMLEKGTEIDAELVLQLPKSLDAIYDDIFQDKYGQGRKRIWQKAQPVLEMILAAANLSYQKPTSPYVTEAIIEERLKYTKEDLQLVRRSFADIVSVRDGIYRMQSNALFGWISKRDGEILPISLDRGIQLLVHGPEKLPKRVQFNI